MAVIENELNFEGAVSYHYGKFPPHSITYSRIYKELARATEAIARFDQMLDTLHNSEILLAPLRNQEAVISSRMEGTISTMDEILRYEADQIAGEDQLKGYHTDVVETWLYQRALKYGQKELETGKPLSEWLMRALHQHLLQFGRGANKSPGQFKTEQNYLVDKSKRNVLFVPVEPQKLQDGLSALVSYLRSDEEVLIKTAISHIEFEALHPFHDGNGRVGRILITLLLWKERAISAPHFYISGYFEEHKDQYTETMRRVSSEGDWTGWCKFFLLALESQAKRNLDIAEKIRDLYEGMKPLFSDALSSKWSINALDFIFTYPVFRNSSFINNSGIPTPSARRFTPVLMEKGFIKTIESASGRRPALYSFEPLLNLVRV